MLENKIEKVSGDQKTLLEIPADRNYTLHNLILSNIEENGEIRFTLKHFSASNNATYPIIQEDVAAGSYFHIRTSVNLKSGDKIKAVTNGGEGNVSLSYYVGETTVKHAFSLQGYWSSSAVYNKLDVVIKDGTSYVAVEDGITGTGEKPEESDLWQPLAYGLRWQGQWEAGRDYRQNDLVSHGDEGEVWIANQDVAAGHEPSHASDYWDFLPLTPQDIEVSKLNERVDDLEQQVDNFESEEFAQLQSDFEELESKIQNGNIVIGDIDFEQHGDTLYNLAQGQYNEIEFEQLREDVDYLLAGGGGGGDGGSLNWETISESDEISLNVAYLVDTSDGSITLTLPQIVGEGDIVRFADKQGSWKLHPVTVEPGGDDNIEGEQTLILDVAYGQISLVSHDGQWHVVV